MKRILVSFLVVSGLMIATASHGAAQSGVQAGIFSAGGNVLSVKARPVNPITSKVLSGVNVTIRWLSSYGITLSNPSGDYSIAKQGSVGTDGTYSYQSFGSTPNVTITWAAANDTTLFTVTVNGGVGTGTFEITNDPTGTPWYFELGGADSTSATPFYASSVSGVSLPIQLASFSAAVVSANSVKLSWTTLSETENYGFEVQRSSEKTSGFASLAGSFIPGHGTTIEQHNYTYTDATAGSGSYYYRLKQIDRDGTVYYSDPIAPSGTTDVKERAPIVFALMQNYPNPFNPTTEIKFSVENTGRATLRLYNILGAEVATLFDGMAEAGQYYKVRVDGSRLASGVYFFRLESGTRSDLKKMVLLK